MRKLIILIALLLALSINGSLSINGYGQTKPLPVTKPSTPATKVEQPVDVPVSEEDAELLERAYQQASDKKKDADLAASIADRIEADAAANVGVSRKTYYLTRNEEGKLVFRLRPPAPTK